MDPLLTSAVTNTENKNRWQYDSNGTYTFVHLSLTPAERRTTTHQHEHTFSLCAKLNSTKQHSFSLDHHYPLDFFHGIFHQSSQGTSIVLALLFASSALFSLPEIWRRLMDRFWLGPRQNVGWLHFMLFYRYSRVQDKMEMICSVEFLEVYWKTFQSMYSYWITLKELERRCITMEQVRMVKILYRENLVWSSAFDETYIPYHPCMVYLPTFTIKINQM